MKIYLKDIFARTIGHQILDYYSLVAIYYSLKKMARLVTCCLLLTACGPQEFDSEEALWEHLKDPANGYLQEKTINGVSFSLLYRPTDLLVQQSMGDTKRKEEIDSLRNHYGQYLYLNLSLSQNGRELLGSMQGGRQNFGQLVNTLSFGMGEKLHLYTQQRDTLELLDHSAPRTYGMSQKTNLLLVYPRDPERLRGDHLTLVAEDLGLNTGDVAFKLKTEKIHKEPRLTFNKKTPAK